MNKLETILIVHNYTKNNFSNLSYELAHYLANKGHKVVFISHQPYFEKPFYENVANGELIVYSWSSPNKRPTGLKDFIWFTKIYQKHKPKICIGHFAGVNITSIMSKILSFGKVKTYMYYHTLSNQLIMDDKSNSFKRKFYKLRTKIINKLFIDYRICPSDMAKIDLNNYFNFKKSIVVLNPIEDRNSLNIVNQEVNQIQISYLGRIDPSKGVFEMLDAFNFYLKQNQNSKIIINIAGGGSNVEELNIMIKNNNKIKYHGILKYETIDTYIKNSNYIIIPSLFDAFNVVTIESLMNAKPVLISNTTGVSSYLEDNKSCFKFNINTQEIIEIFKKVENNTSNYDNMCLEARKIYKELFTIEKYCETMFNILIK